MIEDVLTIPSGTTNHASPSPSSPPTTTKEPKKVESNEHAAWDEPKTKSPSPPKKTDNPRWPRAPQATQHTRLPWPKARDMRPQPSSSESNGGISCGSHSNGDPDYDVKKLLDWNGDWLPAPEEWAARKGHTNRHLGKFVEQWVAGHGDECTALIDFLDLSMPNQGTQAIDGQHDPHNVVCKEIVPRYWVQSHVEQMSLRDFWKDLPDRAPSALSDVDIMEEPPWWERFEDGNTCYINGLVVPEAKVNFEDPENPTPMLALASAADKVDHEARRKAEKYRRTMLRRSRPIPETKLFVRQIDDRRIVPKANVYIRPVQPADVRGIAVSSTDPGAQ